MAYTMRLGRIGRKSVGVRVPPLAQYFLDDDCVTGTKGGVKAPSRDIQLGHTVNADNGEVVAAADTGEKEQRG